MPRRRPYSCLTSTDWRNGSASGAIASAAAAPPVTFPSLPSTETLESLATFDGRRSPSAFTAVSAGRASPAVAEPAVSPTVSPSKRDSLRLRRVGMIQEKTEPVQTGRGTLSNKLGAKGHLAHTTL